MHDDSQGRPSGRPHSPFAQRRAGLLLHPTSLPGDSPCGTLGESARDFVDFVAASGFTVWQTLPLGPTHADLSPYQCFSVFAGNPSLIAVEQLITYGWLDGLPEAHPGESDSEHRARIYREALAGFEQRASGDERVAFNVYRQEQAYWLEDYALYQALRSEFGERSWADWPAELRDRDGDALEQARHRLKAEIDRICLEQFVFQRQWLSIKEYANDRGVLLFGDMPIFVAHDSAEVWAHREYFTLAQDGTAETVAGVPPDYFSETGQRWGNPHYRWETMEAEGFEWWRRRIEHQLVLFDLIRIDHFRGFEAYWEIPAEAETGMHGRWVKAPGDALFRALQQEFDPLPLVAEDLGLITEEVEELRHRFRLPGMKVLQFAFEGGPGNPYLPHNHERDYVAYTGTHDNDTTLGWFEEQAPEQQAHVMEYLGNPNEGMPWPLIRAAMASVAQMSIVPMQDVLGLGTEHRMNVPGVQEGNWRWRFDWDMVRKGLSADLVELIKLYGRHPSVWEDK